jgi:hypothetical protein
MFFSLLLMWISILCPKIILWFNSFQNIEDVLGKRSFCQDMRWCIYYPRMYLHFTTFKDDLHFIGICFNIVYGIPTEYRLTVVTRYSSLSLILEKWVF